MQSDLNINRPSNGRLCLMVVTGSFAERIRRGAALACGLLMISLLASPSQARTCDKFDAAYMRYTVTDRTGSAALKQCVGQSGGVTEAMRECMRIETDRLNKLLPPALEKAVVAIRRQCSGRAGNALRQSQATWRTNHGKRCAAEMQDGGGGTAGLLIGDSCVMNEHRRRLEWLKQL
jgi:uncharacterized protein YecT (DUF1311 family)